jgi:hypothetical protein
MQFHWGRTLEIRAPFVTRNRCGGFGFFCERGRGMETIICITLPVVFLALAVFGLYLIHKAGK